MKPTVGRSVHYRRGDVTFASTIVAVRVVDSAKAEFAAGDEKAYGITLRVFDPFSAGGDQTLFDVPFSFDSLADGCWTWPWPPVAKD